MDRLQRNGGTAGLVAGMLLGLLVLLVFSLGLDFDEFGDPAKVLPVIGQKPGVVAAIGVIGAVASALGILLAAGLAARLRDAAPTRATAQLYFAVIGLSALALDGVIRWLGGSQLAAAAAADQVAASHAYVGLNAIAIGIAGFGNAFTGASLVIVGWAITATRVLSSALGWVGIVAGVVTLLSVFVPPSSPVFLLSFVLTIVWLLWAGSALRSAATR